MDAGFALPGDAGLETGVPNGATLFWRPALRIQTAGRSSVCGLRNPVLVPRSNPLPPGSRSRGGIPDTSSRRRETTRPAAAAAAHFPAVHSFPHTARHRRTIRRDSAETPLRAPCRRTRPRGPDGSGRSRGTGWPAAPRQTATGRPTGSERPPGPPAPRGPIRRRSAAARRQRRRTRRRRSSSPASPGGRPPPPAAPGREAGASRRRPTAPTTAFRGLPPRPLIPSPAGGRRATSHTARRRSRTPIARRKRRSAPSSPPPDRGTKLTMFSPAGISAVSTCVGAPSQSAARCGYQQKDGRAKGSDGRARTTTDRNLGPTATKPRRLEVTREQATEAATCGLVGALN